MAEPAYSLLILAGRLCLSAVYLYSGLHKAICFGAALDEYRAARMPAPETWVVLTVILHLSASLCLIFGRLIAPAALSLAVFTLLATIRVHDFWRYRGEERLEISRIAAANLAIVGGLLLLAATGSGRFTV